MNTTFSAGTPQIFLAVDRTKAETLGVTVGQVFAALQGYLGSTYVTQFNKFNNVFQVYAQAEAQHRLAPQDILRLKIKTPAGEMVPLGSRHDGRDGAGPALDQPVQPVPVGDPGRRPGAGLQLGPGDGRSWTRSPPRPCRPATARRGRRCRTRKKSSATRST